MPPAPPAATNAECRPLFIFVSFLSLLARTQFPPSSSCNCDLSDIHYQLKEPFSECGVCSEQRGDLSSHRTKRVCYAGCSICPAPLRGLCGWVGGPQGRHTETNVVGCPSKVTWQLDSTTLHTSTPPPQRSRRVRENVGALGFILFFLLHQTHVPSSPPVGLSLATRKSQPQRRAASGAQAPAPCKQKVCTWILFFYRRSHPRDLCSTQPMLPKPHFLLLLSTPPPPVSPRLLPPHLCHSVRKTHSCPRTRGPQEPNERLEFGAVQRHVAAPWRPGSPWSVGRGWAHPLLCRTEWTLQAAGTGLGGTQGTLPRVEARVSVRRWPQGNSPSAYPALSHGCLPGSLSQIPSSSRPNQQPRKKPCRQNLTRIAVPASGKTL